MESLLQNLETLLSNGANGHEEEVRKLLEDYVRAQPLDWNKWRIFAPCKYARNLVKMTMNFEAIVICWDDNQESPVHNHSAQNCWFAVLEGNVEEVYYNLDSKTGRIAEGERNLHNFGQVGWIKDDIALHKVRAVGGKACTLHIYSKPIPLCNIYDPVTGEVTQRKCGFFSVDGKKQCPDGTAMYQQIYQLLETEIFGTVPEVVNVVPPPFTTSSQGTLESLVFPPFTTSSQGTLEGPVFPPFTSNQGTLFGTSVMSMVSESTKCSGLKEEFTLW